MLAVVAWLSVLPRPVHAQAPATATEASVKAAFLYQFGNYVEWPPGSFAGPQSPVVIAVVGDREVARELAGIVRGRTAAGRPVQVLSPVPGEEAMPAAHIVYLGSDAPPDYVPAGQGALLVTDARGGLAAGGMIDFVIDDGRLRFDVSLEAAAAAGLRISSRLLTVARRVTGGA